MERYLLDTNVLVFLILGEYDNISPDIASIIENYNNQLYVSSISIVEFLQLYRIKKIKPKQYKTAFDLLQAVEKDFYIKILPFAKEHAKTLSKLKAAPGHNDPFDHSIISHAITERLALVSSDKKFADYAPQKLKFTFNER